MSRPTIKLYGERNTGTNYLQRLIKWNLDANLLPGTAPRWVDTMSCYAEKAAICLRVNSFLHSFELIQDSYFALTLSNNLGWKHSLVRSTEESNRLSKPNRVVFVTLTKNPYAWLLSLYKRPYHNWQFVKSLSFSEFLLHPWRTVRREKHSESFVNPIDMWNRKNRSYLSLKERQRTLNLRYEDLVADPEAVVGRLAQFASAARLSSEFKNELNSTKRDRDKSFSYYQQYYLNERWSEKLSDDDVSVINQYLDDDLLERFSYRKLASGGTAAGTAQVGRAA